jgi:hypothetical protein
MRRFPWIATLAAWTMLVVSRPAGAFHTLREGLSDLLGPTAWGLYIILPIPYLVIGLIVYRIYRAYRQQQRSESYGPHRNGQSNRKEGD